VLSRNEERAQLLDMKNKDILYLQRGKQDGVVEVDLDLQLLLQVSCRFPSKIES